jgi:hypothetical protein
MNVRAVRFRNLLLLVAIFATVVLAGCWDNSRNMQHVLDDGYSTIVEITAAQYQRLAPFAFDGWRPRFVEQSLSVDLKWDGKDGKPHLFKKVPVTGTFAATIVSGKEVKLAILPAKVLDDPHAVPVINGDAASRFASLQQWIRFSAYIAVVGWAGFAAMSIWLGQGSGSRAGSTTAASPVAPAFPPRRTLFGLVALIIGAILTFHAWSEEDANSGPAGGIETTAEILYARTIPSAGGATARVLLLSWKDAQGVVHHFGPIHVSADFWNKITRNGELAVHQTRIRYSGQGTGERPVLLEDQPQPSWRLRFALVAGLILMGAGAASLFSAARAVRRQAVGEGAAEARKLPAKK